MMQIAARNYQNFGNPLGSNEIMGLMFHRDVMVLGLSDGVMCGATGFSLILQKLIQRGYLSWDREGWIIQSVSPVISLVYSTLSRTSHKKGHWSYFF
jgi:sterol O-acyltransferase